MYDSETSLKSIDTGSYNLSRPQSLKSESYEDVGSARDRSAESSRQHLLSVTSSTSLYEESNFYEEVNTGGHFDPSMFAVFNNDTTAPRPRRHKLCAFVIRCTLIAILFVVMVSTSSLLVVKFSDKLVLKQFNNVTCVPCDWPIKRKRNDTKNCCYSSNGNTIRRQMRRLEDRIANQRKRKTLARFVTFVDGQYLLKIFDEYGSSVHLERSIEITDWHGRLHRNRSFTSTEPNVKLRFLKEDSRMGYADSDKVFMFNNATGIFTARYDGLHIVYANM